MNKILIIEDNHTVAKLLEMKIRKELDLDVVICDTLKDSYRYSC